MSDGPDLTVIDGGRAPGRELVDLRGVDDQLGAAGGDLPDQADDVDRAGRVGRREVERGRERVPAGFLSEHGQPVGAGREGEDRVPSGGRDEIAQEVFEEKGA